MKNNSSSKRLLNWKQWKAIEHRFQANCVATLRILAIPRQSHPQKNQRTDQRMPAPPVSRSRQTRAPERRFIWILVTPDQSRTPACLQSNRGRAGDHPVPVSLLIAQFASTVPCRSYFDFSDGNIQTKQDTTQMTLPIMVSASPEIMPTATNTKPAMINPTSPMN